MPRILYVATVVKTHIMEFHIPYLKLFHDNGWITAVAAKNDYENPDECEIPYCDKYYNIPYRSLLPKEYDNMLVAGRCLSATHEAQASVRIMPICACLGEAAGTAAALAYKSKTSTHTIDIAALKARLKDNGAEI